MVIHTNKRIRTEMTHRMMYLPDDLKEDIKRFWNEQIKNNSNLFNGEVWNVTKIEEREDEIVLILEKTDYAHYLYDERHGIDERYACHNLSSGVYLITRDGFGVVGELNDSTSYPRCLQVAGGGVDTKDLVDNEFDLVKTAQRELKEELNIELENKEQISKYNFEYLEIPEKERHAYSVIIKAMTTFSADELREHFERYKKFMEENKGEKEFSKLHFLKIGKAVEQLNELSNPKRLYITQMFDIEDNEKNKQEAVNER